ncbi:MAG: phosphoethanolamine--lipid A transferase [Alphaproteobacteria bacterium]
MPLKNMPLGTGVVSWLLAAFLVATANLTFFDHTTAVYGFADNAAFLVSQTLVLLAVMVFVTNVFSLVLPFRVVATVLLLVAAPAAYFMDTFGSIIDTEMIRNVVQTDVNEAGDLMSAGFLIKLGLLGILPAAVIWLIPLQRRRFVRREMMLAATAALAVVVALGCMLPFSDAYASFFREHKPLRYYTNPTYPIYSSVKFLVDSNKTAADQTYREVVEKAEISPEDESHELVVVVVGETARADHFGLLGYDRDTTPQLSKRDNIVGFTQAKSCGTSTAISVPCMFSLSRRDEFNIKTAEQTENVLDILVKAGVNVIWRDNNSGSQGVAGRITYQNFKHADANPDCDDVECRDTGMLAGLAGLVDGAAKDTLIVLHQMGSHGPAYFKRYPPEFETFTPVCKSIELQNCSNEEIVNAFDNTIVYTDYVLDQAIRFLEKHQDTYETTLIYMSDHGESLGEMGVYLHGMPYWIAPEAQTHVPLIVWAGPSSDIDLDALRDIRDAPVAHDDFSRILLDSFEVAVDADHPIGNAMAIPLKPESDHD